MIEVVFELFGELIFQVVFTLLGELFSGAIGATFSGIAKMNPPPTVKALLYLAGGCLLAWLSLKLFPNAFAHLPDTRVAILIGSPLFCGAMMGLVGGWRKKRKGQIVNSFSLASFGYGVLFASPIAITRFVMAH